MMVRSRWILVSDPERIPGPDRRLCRCAQFHPGATECPERLPAAGGQKNRGPFEALRVRGGGTGWRPVSQPPPASA